MHGGRAPAGGPHLLHGEDDSLLHGRPASSFIIVTESGILHRLRKLVPGKEFIPAPTEQCSCSTCPYMKMNTLEKLYHALRDLTPAVELPEDLRKRAEAPLLRMLEQSKS